MYHNDACGSGHRGRRRARLRRAGLAAAVLALIGLLATACGGGSSPASASGGGGGGGSISVQAQVQAGLAYARCMRAHGVPDFPDPDSNGGFQGVPAASSQVTAADHVCHHLLIVGAQMSKSQWQHVLGQLVEYARCMRAHGLPNFPDPHTVNGGVAFGGDIARNSPQYQSANQACQHLLPRGS